MAWISQGDLETGLREFHLVLESAPDYVPAYFQMGQALAEAGRTPDAREVLTRGISAAQAMRTPRPKCLGFWKPCERFRYREF